MSLFKLTSIESISFRALFMLVMKMSLLSFFDFMFSEIDATRVKFNYLMSS